MWKIRSILFSAPAVILCTAFMASLSLLCSPFDKSGRLQHKLARAWARMLLGVAFAECEVIGLENLAPGRQYVVVSNHASYMDTPAVLASLPLEIRFFAKKGLFSIPFLGWHLQRSGHIPVVRGDARASLKSLLEAANQIHDRGISVLLFPEGGRTEAGLGLRPFMEGAAFLAIKSGMPAVPIGLVNTRGILPMHSGILRPGKIQVRIGEPIDTAGMTPRDRGRLNETLRERVAELTGEPMATPA